MRALLTALGTRGDVQPLLALGHALRDAGHEVVICAPQDFSADVSAAGLAYHPLEFQIGAETAKAGNSPTRVMSMIRRGVDAEFSAVRSAPGAFDVYLSGGLASGGAAVAEAKGVLHRKCLFCPELIPSGDHPSPIVPLGKLPRWLNRLSWWMYGQIWEASARAVTNRHRGELGLAPLRTTWLPSLGLTPLIAADPWLAPTPSDVPVTTTSSGAWLMPPGAPLPADLEAFLAAGTPPAYFGFGSMGDGSPNETVTLLVEVARRAGVRALISAGWAGYAPNGLPDTVRVIGLVDHSRLFPRCAAIVHHGGAGTTTAAAIAGVPQVVVPHLGDQFWWARRVQELGIGPKGLPRRRLSVARLEGALREALSERVARAAREGALRVVRDGTTRTVRELEALVGGGLAG